MKTHLAVYYRHHIRVTDQVCDAPTVRILNHILLEEEYTCTGARRYTKKWRTPRSAAAPRSNGKWSWRSCS